MKHSTGRPTTAQSARLTRLSRMRCIACILWGADSDCGRVEVHHLVDKGYRRLSGGHEATIPLGSWHHRGLRKNGWSRIEMDDTFGPSRELEHRRFTAVFGTDRDLLARVNATLAKENEK